MKRNLLDLLYYFNLKKRPVVVVDKMADIQEKSANAIAIFESTKQSLLVINDEVNGVVAVKEAEINKLQDEVKVLQLTATNNAKIANKIAEFLK